MKTIKQEQTDGEIEGMQRKTKNQSIPRQTEAKKQEKTRETDR
jgi:hypothetical protein